jgi:hypothetical protein
MASETWVEQGDRRYRITNTGMSSARLGGCEVCGKHVTDVFHQVEELQYAAGWTRLQCQDLFGHDACLVAARRPSARAA